MVRNYFAGREPLLRSLYRVSDLYNAEANVTRRLQKFRLKSEGLSSLGPLKSQFAADIQG